MNERPIAEVLSLSKTFPGNRALSGLDLAVFPGEVHALLGANGSGKSTLIKVLSGFHLPDPGATVTIAGEPLQFGSPEHSYRLGCRFVHQDLGLVGSRSVLDNLHLGSFPSRLGTIRSGAARHSALDMLKTVGLALDPNTKVSDLSAAEQTGVALARAVRANAAYPPRLLVLDEPTARLPADEVDHLVAMIKQAAAQGVAILFVSHHMDEVHRIADSITVLRDGLVVGRFRNEAVEPHDLVELVAGEAVLEVVRDMVPAFTTAAAVPNSLEIESLCSGPLGEVSFSAGRGEVLGIAGITGSGRELILSAIFGAVQPIHGIVRVNGRAIKLGRPDRAIAAGMGFLPPDRKINGGIMDMSARKNLTLADLHPFWTKWRLSRRRELRETAHWFKVLSVRPAEEYEQDLLRFSGGNQQKILFAKWMRLQPSVLLLDEPSQGVDVAAKAQIHLQVLAAAAAGMTIVISSTDNEELINICSRVLVMRDGSIAVELGSDRLTVPEIVLAMSKVKSHSSAEEGT